MIDAPSLHISFRLCEATDTEECYNQQSLYRYSMLFFTEEDWADIAKARPIGNAMDQLPWLLDTLVATFVISVLVTAWLIQRENRFTFTKLMLSVCDLQDHQSNGLIKFTRFLILGGPSLLIGFAVTYVRFS